MLGREGGHPGAENMTVLRGNSEVCPMGARLAWSTPAKWRIPGKLVQLPWGNGVHKGGGSLAGLTEMVLSGFVLTKKFGVLVPVYCTPME